MKQPVILFCEDPLQSKKVEPDFEAEYTAAIENGFETALVNYEELLAGNEQDKTLNRILYSDVLKEVIYRGWMLTPVKYTGLYNQLLSKNHKLINTPQEYQNCHYLPDSLQYIQDRTPLTIFEKYTGSDSIEAILNRSEIFGKNPVIIKDYVKSEKHDWDTACFVKDASDKSKLRETILNFMALRGTFLNEGMVVREFLALNELTIHSKSQMPLTEEYRLFFYRHQLVGLYDYWEEGVYAFSKPDTKDFEQLAAHIGSHFFSMDIARKQNGDFVIIELGDGQVSGLPDALDKNLFYRKLKELREDK